MGADEGERGGSFFFFCNETATTEIYTTEDTLSLHDALPILARLVGDPKADVLGYGHGVEQRAVLRSEEHTSELQSPSVISYAVFCWKKNNRHREARGAERRLQRCRVGTCSVCR